MKLDTNSLAHTKWECKYHIVFAPKYRRQIIYGKIKADIGQMLRKLCEYKGIEILEAEACKEHIHLFLNEDDKGYYSYSDVFYNEALVTETRGLSSELEAEKVQNYMNYKQKVSAYIKIGNTYIESSQKSTSMKDMILSVMNNQWDGMSNGKKDNLAAIYTNYGVKAEMDSWDTAITEKLKPYAEAKN